MLENVILGIVSSAVTSTLFLLFLYRLRPRIAISPYISKDERADGSVEYGFKFVNRTAYPLFDVKTRLKLRTSEAVPQGFIWASKALTDGDIWLVPAYDKKDKDCKYAQRMFRAIDLEPQWNDTVSSELVFEVMARHSLSGFMVVETMTFHKKRQCIKLGSHHFGDSLDVS